MIFANATFAVGLIVVLGVAYLCWAIYMLTFKTDTFIKIMKADDEWKDRKIERAGKVASSLIGFASKLKKK